jgi:hypothetical protein
LENNIIIIPSLDNKRLRIDTWSYWYEGDANLHLYDFDEKRWIYLEIKNDEYIFYRMRTIWYYENKEIIIMWKIQI